MYNDENNLYNYTYRKDGSELSTSGKPSAPADSPAPRGPNLR